ncbi:unnamed protein product [Brassica rapa subsp. narinosa]
MIDAEASSNDFIARTKEVRQKKKKQSVFIGDRSIT